MNAVLASFFDGKSARNRSVTLSLSGETLTFSGPDTPITIWSIAGLHSIDAPASGQPYRLTHDKNPGARLIVSDQTFIDKLVSHSSHLKGGYSWLDIFHLLGCTFGGIAFFAALGWVCLNFLPDPVARMLPRDWRDRTGNQMETAMAGDSKRCSSPEAEHAWGTLIAHLAEADPNLPPLTIHVYDLGMVNAFTVTGGHIIFTKKLIDKADGPEEVAGVLAHEIGHASHYHPEAQMVRLAGVSVLTSFFGGSGNGGLAGDSIFIAAVLRNSRVAEEEADAYARTTLAKAQINPLGLKTFFEKIQKMEGEYKIDSSALHTLGSIFSTHPGTAERIGKIEPLPSGVVPKPAMSDEDWKALKALCSKP